MALLNKCLSFALNKCLAKLMWTWSQVLLAARTTAKWPWDNNTEDFIHILFCSPYYQSLVQKTKKF